MRLEETTLEKFANYINVLIGSLVGTETKVCLLAVEVQGVEILGVSTEGNSMYVITRNGTFRYFKVKDLRDSVFIKVPLHDLTGMSVSLKAN